jgi:hypothetical protein
VIGRTAERLKGLAAEGAEPFATDLTDVSGVAKAFAAAKGVYVMMPPNLTSVAHQNLPCAKRPLCAALNLKLRTGIDQHG